ncbi:MAG TPA: HD domain-containing protein [Clostridiales bacterium]|nr:HD domain-containing protein [Clostridiales bacterium]
MQIFTRHHYKQLLEERLGPKRYHHSLMVEQAAMELAALHHGDWYRAGFAGLLHDICRDNHPTWQQYYMECHGFSLSDEWRLNPQIWHSVCGSLYLQHELDISDPEILRAVRYHTTGRAGMSQLEQIVFVADAVSEDRNFPGVEELRRAARYSLDEAMFLCLSHTLEEVAKRGLPLVRESWEAYNEYSRKKAIGAKP